MLKLIENATVIHDDTERTLKEVIIEKYGFKRMEVIEQYLKECILKYKWNECDISLYKDGWLPEDEIICSILGETGITCDSDMLYYSMANLGVIGVPIHIGKNGYQYQVQSNYPYILKRIISGEIVHEYNNTQNKVVL